MTQKKERWAKGLEERSNGAARMRWREIGGKDVGGSLLIRLCGIIFLYYLRRTLPNNLFACMINYGASYALDICSLLQLTFLKRSYCPGSHFPTQKPNLHKRKKKILFRVSTVISLCGCWFFAHFLFNELACPAQILKSRPILIVV